MLLPVVGGLALGADGATGLSNFFWKVPSLLTKILIFSGYSACTLAWCLLLSIYACTSLSYLSCSAILSNSPFLSFRYASSFISYCLSDSSYSF